MKRNKLSAWTVLGLGPNEGDTSCMTFIFPAAVYQQLPQLYLTSTSSFSNPLLLRISFKGDILNLTSEHLCLKIHLSARWAAGAQKTSVPCSDKPAGVRDSVRGPGWWRGCRLFMEAPWIPQKSSSLMKDSLSMTVLGPLVIDLGSQDYHWQLHCFGNSESLLIISLHDSGLWNKGSLLFYVSPLHLWVFWASYHGSTPPEARLDHGHSYFRKAMTEFIPTLPAWPSTFSGTPVQNSSAHMALDVFSKFGGVGIKWKSYYSYFLVVLGMLSVFNSLLVFDPRI